MQVHFLSISSKLENSELANNHNIYSSLATHGTGIDIGNLATLATSLKFVSGTGEV